MSSNTVSILITAKDLASRRLRTLSKGVDTLGSKLSRVSSIGLRVGTVLGGLAGGLSAVSIVKKGASYEHAMNTVRYVARATSKEFEAMDATAKELGESTEWSASQAAEGLLFLNRAGFGAKRSIEALPGVLDLATAGNIELGRAADIASNVLSAMRKDVGELNDVNDIFVATINTSNTDMEMLSESFKYSASVAAAYGYELNTLSGLIGLLGNSGIQGSMAGTQLAHAFSQVQKVFDKYDVSAINADGSTKDLVDAIQLLEEHGASAQEVMEIFGQRSGRAVAALMGTGTAAVKAYLATLEDVKGEAARVANGMRDDLLGDYKQFLSVTEAISNSIAENNNEFTRSFLQGLTESLREGKGEIVAWADNAVETVWTVFKSFLVGAGEFVDNVKPAIEGIGDAISSIWDGFRALPTWVQEVGLVGAFFGGMKGKVILATIAHMTNKIRISAKGLQAVFDDKISFGEWLFGGSDFEDLLKERGVIGEEEYDAIKMGGMGAGESWARGFVDGIDEKIKAARKKIASLNADEDEPKKPAPAPPTSTAGITPATNSAPQGVLSGAKRAEMELREFKALQATALSQLDGLLAHHLVSVQDYYAKRREAVDAATEYEIKKIREAAEAQAAKLREQAEQAEDSKDAQEYLNKAVEAEAEAKTRILELEQQRLQVMDDLVERERNAAESAERQRRKKEDLIREMRTNVSGDSGLDSGFDAQMGKIEEQYRERMRLLEEYHATEEEMELAKAEKVKAIQDATADHEKAMAQQRVQWLSDMVSGMGGLMTTLNQMGLQNSREGFAVYKAFATAEALISTYSAATAAYWDGVKADSPVLGSVYAAMAVAQGLAKVALIASSRPQGYAHGGLISGPDRGDRADNVTIRATPGEYMMDRPTVRHYGRGVMEALRTHKIPRSALAGFSVPAIPSPLGRAAYAMGGEISPSSGGNGDNTGGSVSVVNLFDMSEVDRHLATRAGERVILNAVVNNPEVIKSVVK